MNIVIFGGMGFLGKNLCERLYKDGHDLKIYTRHNVFDYSEEYAKKNKIQFIKGNFSTEKNFDNIVKNADCVYQLISTSTPSINNPINDLLNTVYPTLRLIEACIRENVKKIIFFSSGGTVYGIPNNIPINIKDNTNPISAYGIQKLMIEKYLEFYHRMYNIDISILRIANPYGKWQKPFSSQGLIANIIAKYYTNETLEIWGDGNVIRDYIFVDDVIDAVIKSMNYKGDTKVFNIGSGVGISINNIIKEIEMILDDHIKKIYIASRKQDVSINILDIKDSIEILKWYPKTSLQEGINYMISQWNNDKKEFCGK